MVDGFTATAPSCGGGVPLATAATFGYPFLSAEAVPAAATNGTAAGGTGATATGKGAPGAVARITGTGSGTAAGETIPKPGGTPGIPLFTPPGILKNRFIGFALMRALIGWPCAPQQKQDETLIDSNSSISFVANCLTSILY